MNKKAKYSNIDNANREIDRLRDLADWYNRSWTLAQRVIDTTVAYGCQTQRSGATQGV